MTVHPTNQVSEKERQSIDETRARLKETMTEPIPEDLNTDLNLLRWVRGYSGNTDRLCQNFADYVGSRRAAGFLGANLPERFFDMPHVAPFLPYIASSRLADTLWSDELNAFLFVERAWAQPKEFIKTFKTSDYLIHCMGYSELLLQLILEREKNQSKDKGPVQFIVIFDLNTVNITDYVNPMSGYMKLWQLRSELWQDWYPEMVQRIFLVNPPRLISVLWKIARLFLSEQNLKRIEIITDQKDIVKHLPKWFVPKEYGGDFVNKKCPGDESGVSVRRKITSDDHYQPLQHYKKRGVDRPKSNKKDISPSEDFTLLLVIPEGKCLLWDFTTSGELDFHIFKDRREYDMVYPKLHLVTNKLAEEGVLDNLPEGEYSLRFHNRSSYFTVKLEYCITIF